MEQIHQIQERLFSIDSTTFERLCGMFLYNHSEFKEIPIPSGKATAKNRPRKGNPDAYYFDGNQYHFLVCTAQDGRKNKRALIKKIIEDITKALSKKKTGIDPGNIAAIHVCLASDIDTAQDQEIRNSFPPYSSLIKSGSRNQKFISTLFFSD